MNKSFKVKSKPKPKGTKPKVVIKRHYQYQDRLFKAEHHKCDLCNDHLPECKDNIESHIDMMNDINDSFESDYDKQEPKLLLCLFCQEEFNIPSWA